MRASSRSTSCASDTKYVGDGRPKRVQRTGDFQGGFIYVVDDYRITASRQVLGSPAGVSAGVENPISGAGQSLLNERNLMCITGIPSTFSMTSVVR